MRFGRRKHAEGGVVKTDPPPLPLRVEGLTYNPGDLSTRIMLVQKELLDARKYRAAREAGKNHVHAVFAAMPDNDVDYRDEDIDTLEGIIVSYTEDGFSIEDYLSLRDNGTSHERATAAMRAATSFEADCLSVSWAVGQMSLTTNQTMQQALSNFSATMAAHNLALKAQP